jgi:hypothetical protein
MSRLVIAAGLKLIVVPIDCTWMRRSLASGSRARALPTPAEPERVAPASASRSGPVPRVVHQNGAGNSAVFCLAPSRPWKARPDSSRAWSKMFTTRTATGPNFRHLQAGRSRRRNQRGSRTRRRVPLDSICPISVCCSGSPSRSRRRHADDAEARPADCR